MRRRPRGAVRSARIRVRAFLRKLDRETPEWMRWLTPWGTSLILHAAALATLGLLVYVNTEPPASRMILSDFPSQLTDDLTTLAPSDHAGDPFTTLTTPDPPSFSLDPKGAENIATPESALPIGPGNGLMSAAIPAPGASTDRDAQMPALSVPRPSVPFSGRQGEAKARLVRREGGSVESEKAVSLGIDWLARHQRKDGSWSLNHRGQCSKGAGCPADAHGESDVAATGLALLPMLGAGHSHMAEGRYQNTIKRGLDWLMAIQKEDGELFTGGGGNTRMYSHAIATMALCEAYGVSRDDKLRAPAERAIRFIVKAQSPDDGGWRYNPGEQGDTSVYGWQMLALRSGQLSGLKVPPDVFKAAAKYLDRAATDPLKSKYAYQPGGGQTPVMSAEGLLVRQYLGWPRESKELSTGVKAVATDLFSSRERNIYYWYYATQLLHNMQNLAWKEWNPRIRNGLVSMQVTRLGCDRGSWDPNKPIPDRWGHEIGRHYTTAMSLLTLEVYYRYLPLYKARDQVVPDSPSAGE